MEGSCARCCEANSAHVLARDASRDPLAGARLEQLTARDIAPDVAWRCGADAVRCPIRDSSNCRSSFWRPICGWSTSSARSTGGVIALVVPTGAGKTRPSANWRRAGACSTHHIIALVTPMVIVFRGARSVMTYSRCSALPLRHTATAASTPGASLERLTSKTDPIDTADMDRGLRVVKEQSRRLQLGAARARVYLTLPAHGEPNALTKRCRVVRRFDAGRLQVWNQGGRAASLGAVLSTTLAAQAADAYLCNGQAWSPRDLSPASDRRLWAGAHGERSSGKNAPNPPATI